MPVPSCACCRVSSRRVECSLSEALETGSGICSVACCRSLCLALVPYGVMRANPWEQSAEMAYSQRDRARVTTAGVPLCSDEAPVYVQTG